MEVKKKIRVNYAPLSFAVSVECVSTSNPIAQVYDSVKGKYLPDRTVVATVLRPIVTIDCADGTWSPEKTRDNISGAKWIVCNNKTADEKWEQDIKVAWGASEYEVLDDSRSLSDPNYDYGDLAIKRNLPAGSNVTLMFACEITDPRTNMKHTLRSEPVVLSTTVKAIDTYAISIEGPTMITYNPFEDDTLFYQYRKDNNLLKPNEVAPAIGEKSYTKRVRFSLYKGGEKISIEDRADITVRLFRFGASTSTGFTEIPVLSSVLFPSLTLNIGSILIDARYITTPAPQAYVIRAYLSIAGDNPIVVAEKQFTLQRVLPAFDVEIVGSDGFSPNTEQMKFEAVVKYRGRKILNPEAVLSIDWTAKTEAVSTSVALGSGASLSLNMADLDFGDNESAVGAEVAAKVIHKSRLY